MTLMFSRRDGMKICVTGKGGSGKSICSVLLARALSAKGYIPVLIDADESNLGLTHMLDLDAMPRSLLEYLGGKPTLQRKMMAAFTSGSSEPRMEVMPQTQVSIGELPPEYVGRVDNIRLLSIGKIERSQEGCACPMGALAKDFLSKLVVEEKDVVVADHEAGIEHFGRGVEKGIDKIIVIVEPSFESVLLAEKIAHLSAELGGNVLVVLNKMTPDAEETTKTKLEKRGISVGCSIAYDPAVFTACLHGKPLVGVRAQEEVAGLVEALGL
jgi:CO dehydrogenase maturation factor